MNGWKYTVAATTLFWSILLASGSAGEAYAGVWLDGTHYLHEEAIFLDQVLGGRGAEVRLAPSLVDTPRPPVYEVGEERSFYAIDMRNDKQYVLQASARAISDKAYIFVENGRPAPSNRIESLLGSFNSIYDKTTAQFGPPPDGIDGDPRIHILLMDILDEPHADGTSVLGYFSAIDQYRNAILVFWSDRHSNEAEVLYIDYTSLSSIQNSAESVVAHEFTHMIQWARDSGESIWVNEGTAVYMESLLGYEVESRISAFEADPSVSLLDWTDSVADYGAAYLFFAYISERFDGASSIAAIVQNRSRGTRGIERALATMGKSVSFQKLFSDWVIANYLDNPDLDGGIYGYTSLDVNLDPSEVESLYPIARKTSKVKPWSARYTEFEKELDDTISLTVQENDGNDIVAQIIVFGDEISVSPVKSGQVSSGTALIPPADSKAVLVVTSQPVLTFGDAYSDYTYSAEIQVVITPVDPTVRRKITTWGNIRRDM